MRYSGVCCSYKDYYNYNIYKISEKCNLDSLFDNYKYNGSNDVQPFGCSRREIN
jgi:hypothetical protein